VRAKKRNWLATVILSLGIVFFITVLAKESSPLILAQRLFLDFVAAGQKKVASVIKPMRYSFSYLYSFRRMARENVVLKDENRYLKEQIKQLKKYKKENKRLAMLVNYKQQLPQKTIAAKVISRSPTSWQSLVTIDAGLNQGVAENMPVITSAGLVGKVVRAAKASAVVQLINDRHSGISAELPRLGAVGIVEGTVERLLRLKFISKEGQVKVGDEVITSGVGGVYPRGLKIGKVAKIINRRYELEKTVLVRPAVNLNVIEEVLIIVK
jgi:rod shape-determining protein MreC